MAGNFEGIRKHNFGIEIEMTGLTRCQAAQAISKVLGGRINHEGGSYDKYTVKDEKGRDWSIVYDGSIHCVDASGNHASRSYSVELNSPVLGYEDIPLLQEVIRALRKAGGKCGPEYMCGTHIHISAYDYTPQQIRNLVNIFASKEDFLWDALQVSSARSGYCKKSDSLLVEQINRKKPKTIEEIKELWYRGNVSEQYRHYSDTRYEDFPRMYRKELFEVEIDGRIREGMAYLMNYGEISPPSPMYYNGIKKGYEDNGMDTSYLRTAPEQAVAYSQTKTMHEDEDFIEDLDNDCDEFEAFQMTFE